MAVSQLAQQLSSLFRDRQTLIATAQLELADRPLHVQILDFAENCLERGIDRMVILPLFLLPGVHVMDDLPAEVEIAKRLRSTVKIIVAPFLGACPQIAHLFSLHRLHLPDRSTILAHGSKRASGNAIVEQLAAQLNLETAYWSIEPSLTDRVTELIEQGTTEIGILPYFLFSGGITDKIAALVAELTEKFPQVQIVLGEPVGNYPELITTIDTILRSIDSSN
jgi:sirohydrochlorin cobaltochelatase